MTPIEFCKAQLTIDETTARNVGSWGDPGPQDPVFAHIGRHDPRSVLRRARVWRALLAASTDLAPLMAEAWSNAPDFDPAWIAEPVEPEPEPEPEVPDGV